MDSERRGLKEPDATVHVVTNVSPHLSIVRVVYDVGIVLWDPQMNVWGVPEILVQ